MDDNMDRDWSAEILLIFDENVTLPSATVSTAAQNKTKKIVIRKIDLINKKNKVSKLLHFNNKWPS